MTNGEQHELQKMLDAIAKRDANAVSEVNSWMGPGPTIENRIWLADGRAQDALAAVATLARYIMKKETGDG